MTEKQLHQLRRTELLELLLQLRKELDGMEAENAQLRSRVDALEQQMQILKNIWNGVQELNAWTKAQASQPIPEETEQ